jgi:hypothetical protein
MAGTRLWIQSIVLVELLGIVWIAFHVGFCHRRTDGSPVVRGLSPPKGFPVLPYAFDTDGPESSNLLLDPLCPLPYLKEWWDAFFVAGPDRDETEAHSSSLRNQHSTDTSSATMPSPPLTLRIMVVFEDAYDILGWSNRISHEWEGIPSYLKGLEKLQFGRHKQQPPYGSLIELQVVPPLAMLQQQQQQQGRRVMTAETIHKVWNHLSSSLLLNDDDDGDGMADSTSLSSMLVLYIPSNLPTAKLADVKSPRPPTDTTDTSTEDVAAVEDNDGGNIVGSGTATADDRDDDDGDVPPPIWSFGLRHNGRGGSSKGTFDAWMLLPSAGDVPPGRLGRLMDVWMAQTVADALDYGGDDDHSLAAATTEEDGNGSVMARDWTSPVWWRLLHDQWREQTMRLYRHYQQEQHSSGGVDVLSRHPILQRGLLSDEARHKDRDDETDPSAVTAALQTSIAEWQDAYSWLLVANGDGGSGGPHGRGARGRTEGMAPSFAVEQYAAIFLPLLFPLVLPFLVSVVKEYKRVKSKRKEKQQQQQLSTADVVDEDNGPGQTKASTMSNRDGEKEKLT